MSERGKVWICPQCLHASASIDHCRGADGDVHSRTKCVALVLDSEYEALQAELATLREQVEAAVEQLEIAGEVLEHERAVYEFDVAVPMRELREQVEAGERPQIALRNHPDGRLDDVVVTNVRMFRMEQMHHGNFWLACNLDNGEAIDFSIQIDGKRLTASVTEMPREGTWDDFDAEARRGTGES